MAHLANTATLTVEFNHLASTSKSLALSTSSRPYQAGDERGRTIAETPQGAPGVLPSDDGPEPTQGTASSTTLTISKAKAVMVIITLAGVSFLNTMGSGILIAALPRIAKDVGIPEALILWPAAVYALAAGCLLLVFGVDCRRCWSQADSLLELAKTEIQIIVFRTLAGAVLRSPCVCPQQSASSLTLSRKALGAMLPLQ
ncbi:integral membrane protein [Blastomyces dermatitidis ATCC 18188]|uniref:Integral membrane protein n=1 Tax=Ajellomyces dermatitidis (strain ATCC 18188 / CBS 674.68) TaxID=653446 RepID=F2TEB9_AJEDA|nr:integral membrane protein [Blastomyces dermatitidis ATCC 18188]